MSNVDFKFDLYDKVDTPLVKDGIITMLGVDDGGKCYYVCNNRDGVAEKWWHEDQITGAIK